MKKSIRHTFYFTQTPQEVWDYLTKPELLEQWLMPTDFKPVIGHKFTFVASQNKEGKTVNMMHYCEVLELIPFQKLSYSWKKDDILVTSRVNWTLTAIEGGTELLLEHNGFELMKDLRAHNGGWIFLCNKLVEILKAPK